MKFALKFSISLKIAVSRENPGRAGKFFFYREGWVLGGGWKNLQYRGAEPLGGLENLEGAETSLDTMIE